MKLLFNITGLLFVIVLAAPIEAYAGGCPGSGGNAGNGRGGGGRGVPMGELPSDKRRHLAKQYEWGKNILEGKEVLRPLVVILAKQQAESLAEVKKRAPNERIDDVVGRLSKQQFSAVQYYLNTRYPASEVNSEQVRAAQYQRSKAAFLDR